MFVSICAIHLGGNDAVMSVTSMHVGPIHASLYCWCPGVMHRLVHFDI